MLSCGARASSWVGGRPSVCLLSVGCVFSGSKRGTLLSQLPVTTVPRHLLNRLLNPATLNPGP